jgi:hypothetical protein
MFGIVYITRQLSHGLVADKLNRGKFSRNILDSP